MDLFKFDYEISENKTRWKANIIGNNSEEAAGFLRKIIGVPINIFSIEGFAVVNGITDEVINKIISICNKTTSDEEIKIMLPPNKEVKQKKVRMKKKESK